MFKNKRLPQAKRQASDRQPYRLRSTISVVSEPNSTKIFIGEKFFGEIHGNLLTKHIRGSKHILRKPRSIANDLEVIQVAYELGVRYILVIDTETGREYRSSLLQIFSKGVIFDRGYGRQIRLAMEFWSQGSDTLAEQLPLWEDNQK